MDSERKLETRCQAAEGSVKELSAYKNQFERRYGEMAIKHNIIHQLLSEVTSRAQSLTGEKAELVRDLKAISRKLAKSQFQTSIFNKYTEEPESDSISPKRTDSIIKPQDSDEEVERYLGNLSKEYRDAAVDARPVSVGTTGWTPISSSQ